MSTIHKHTLSNRYVADELVVALIQYPIHPLNSCVAAALLARLAQLNVHTIFLNTPFLEGFV